MAKVKNLSACDSGHATGNARNAVPRGGGADGMGGVGQLVTADVNYHRIEVRAQVLHHPVHRRCDLKVERGSGTHNQYHLFQKFSCFENNERVINHVKFLPVHD